MNERHVLKSFGVFVILLVLVVGMTQAQAPEPQSPTAPEYAVGTSFTYQGYLSDGGAPANDAYDFQFTLYDASSGGNQVGVTFPCGNVPVTEGTFTVVLNFGQVFNNAQLWLEVAVRTGDSIGVYTILSPRQRLTATPYALYALDARSAVDAVYAVNADMLDGQHGFVYYQLRGSSSVPANHFIVSTATSVSAGYTSIAIGADGLPIISYRSVGASVGLKVAHCNDLTCSGDAEYMLDTGDVGQFSSITIGTDGFPIISYYDAANDDLKVAHCDDVTCSSVTPNTVDSTGNVGQYTSIAIGSDGLPIISYYDATDHDLEFAHCSNAACSSATLRTLVSTNDVGKYSSIALGVDGLPIIGYFDDTNNTLQVLHCKDNTCSTQDTPVTIDDVATAGHISIAIGVDGRAIVAYCGNLALRVAHCDNTRCSTATKKILDFGSPNPPFLYGYYTSIMMRANGLPIISYYALTQADLKVALCNDFACSEANLHTLDSAGDVGKYTSITLGADGLPIISYIETATTNNLKTLHCANVLCVPYWRQR